MKREWNEILPQSRLGFQFGQPRFGWRTTTASFRCEKLEQVRSLRAALKYAIGRSSSEGET